MLRRLILALAAVAVFSPLMISAQTEPTVIPPHVNIHNGFIELRNQIQQIGTSGATWRVTLKYHGHVMQDAKVNAGDTIYLNVCCIAAGSLYDVEINLRGSAKATIRPQLCNVRGIPFGYGVVVFTGHIAYDPKTHGYPSYYEPHVPTVPCPVAPKG